MTVSQETAACVYWLPNSVANSKQRSGGFITYNRVSTLSQTVEKRAQTNTAQRISN